MYIGKYQFLRMNNLSLSCLAVSSAWVVIPAPPCSSFSFALANADPCDARRRAGHLDRAFADIGEIEVAPRRIAF